MNRSDQLTRENEALRDRLSRLSEAGRRINESLELDEVLQEVLDSARALTDARYGVITLLEDETRIEEFLSSGMTPEEARRIWDTPDGMRIFDYLGSLSEPLRIPDLLGWVKSRLRRLWNVNCKGYISALAHNLKKAAFRLGEAAAPSAPRPAYGPVSV